MSSKIRKKCQIIAIYVTIGATNLTIIFSFMLHVGYDIYASEMKTKSENILQKPSVELLHNDSEAYSVNQGIAVLKLAVFSPYHS